MYENNNFHWLIGYFYCTIIQLAYMYINIFVIVLLYMLSHLSVDISSTAETTPSEPAIPHSFS